MAPLSTDLFRRNFNPDLPSQEFLRQWKTPGDVFSVLLILGGDVVLRALAQLSGSGITPVAFSFGIYKNTSDLHSLPTNLDLNLSNPKDLSISMGTDNKQQQDG